jgi:hypothetical protein
MNRNEELLNKVTATNSESLTSIVNCLREYGICILPNYISDEICDSVRNSCMTRAEVGEDMDFEDGSYRRFDGPKTIHKQDKRVYHIDCFNEDMLKFKDDSFLKMVCKVYYWEKQNDYSVHVQIYDRHNEPDIPMRGFHIDTFEISTFKAMLYLSDVEEKDGPTSYVLKTHSDDELRRLKKDVWGPGYKFEGLNDEAKHPTNFNRDELGDNRLNDWVKVVAKKGSLILFDTWGVHCGTNILEGGDRHVVVNYYRPGKDLSRSDFGYDSKKDFEKYHLNVK